jgi:hypothetical protein
MDMFSFNINVKVPALTGYFMSSLGLALMPFVCKISVWPGLYICKVLIQVGTTLISCASSLNNCVKKDSIITAITISNLFRALGILAAIGGLFYLLNDLPFTVSLPVASVIFLATGVTCTLML